jgi:ABC-type glycerol-3-phosphate transport system substrate-binding protein
MKKNRLFYLLSILLVVVFFITACSGGQKPTTGDKTTDNPTTSEKPADSKPSEAPVEEEALEPYTFTHYYNYDWWGIKDWGADEVSKALTKKFNITVEFSKPDADPKARLNTMVSAGDLPDSIMMDRGPDNINLAKLGLLQPLEPYMEKNPNYADNILANTIEMLKIEGKLYGVPNWARKAASGGNDAWNYDMRVYEDAGSPQLKTFEDLYAYATKVKNDVPNTKEGLSVFPVLFRDGTDGNPVGRSFYRSYGGNINGWYTVLDGKYQLAFRDELFKEATMEANKWWREGLMSPTQFTDNGDQILEKLVAGRVGLLWYDSSQDESNHFRKILMETYPGDTYEMIKPFPFPPAKGLSEDDIFADFQSTVGWNVTCITTSAEQPQRIFDLWTYLLTKEAAILQMYGPQGDLWDELDSNGLPILKKAESEISSDETNRLGLWFWMQPGQSDNVVTTKFAINSALPAEKQNWVITNQSDYLTPIMWLTDEFVGIGDDIDPQSNEGINRTLVDEYIKATYPLVIMAETPEKAAELYQSIVDFADKNGSPAVEAMMDAKYQDNVKKVGTGLTRGRYAK